MTHTHAYSIRSLMHAYNREIALDIPHFDIPSGRICAFTGPNGSGKTTLLSILALLLNPLSGSVRLDGVETVHRRNQQRLRRKVTLVHQKPVLFSTSVRKNIAYGLKALGFSSKEIHSRVQTIIDETRLSDVAGKHARSLSGGEAQRTVLARALVLETPIILLDEPTTSLDDASKPVLANLLSTANQKRNVTIIMATHDLNFVSSLTDWIVRFEGGKLIEPSDF